MSIIIQFASISFEGMCFTSEQTYATLEKGMKRGIGHLWRLPPSHISRYATPHLVSGASSPEEGRARRLGGHSAKIPSGTPSAQAMRVEGANVAVVR